MKSRLQKQTIANMLECVLVGTLQYTFWIIIYYFMLIGKVLLQQLIKNSMLEIIANVFLCVL